MGCLSNDDDCQSDELPVREVRIRERFALGRHEVTFAEWDACVGAGHRPDLGWGRGSRPVIHVSWEDARAYVAWLSWETGEPYRLPSEAEWEYAARAGTTTRYHFGNDERELCRWGNVADLTLKPELADSTWAVLDCGDGHVQTAPVASYGANGFGLHDMHGNVWEWVEDCWNEGYRGAPPDERARLSGNCDVRVLRGGSWVSNPGDQRAANRNRNATGFRDFGRGFRVARTLTP